MGIFRIPKKLEVQLVLDAWPVHTDVAKRALGVQDALQCMRDLVYKARGTTAREISRVC